MQSNFDEQFIQMVQQPPAPEPKKPKTWLKPLIIAVGAVVAIVIIVLLIVALSSKTQTPDESAKENELGDITSVKETLNEDYQKAVIGTAYSNYETNHKDTAFAHYNVPQICEYLKVTSCDELAAPETLSNFVQANALNSNSLNYYLDNGHIVIMKAIYTDSASMTDPYPYVIYARMGGLYYVFDPMSQYDVYMSMEQLFNEIVGVPSFYVTEKGKDGK